MKRKKAILWFLCHQRNIFEETILKTPCNKYFLLTNLSMSICLIFNKHSWNVWARCLYTKMINEKGCARTSKDCRGGVRYSSYITSLWFILHRAETGIFSITCSILYMYTIEHFLKMCCIYILEENIVANILSKNIHSTFILLVVHYELFKT